MSAGPGQHRDTPSVDPDFCVVATSLHRSRESACPAAIASAGASFPELRRTVRPSRTPLLQQRLKSPGNSAGQLLVSRKLAPFAGELCVTSTKHLDALPDTSTTSVDSSKSRVATKASAAEDNSLNPDNCCDKLAGRVPADFSEEEWLEGRTRSTSSSIATAPKDTGTAKTPATLSTISNAECKRVSRLEAVSEDVLVQICDYIQEKDIVRVSTVSAAMFDERLWQQLHLVRYGLPTSACLKGLPFARTSRLQLQSDFPIHHARLFSIRHHHECIRSTIPPGDSCCSRLMFAAAALTREDHLLREQEAESRLERADARRKQHTTRAFLLRDMAVAKRASTEERMAMVDMRSVVERHAYAPGCHPKALHAASSWREGHGRGGRGKAKGAATVTSPSLTGVFEEA